MTLSPQLCCKIFSQLQYSPSERISQSLLACLSIDTFHSENWSRLFRFYQRKSEKCCRTPTSSTRIETGRANSGPDPAISKDRAAFCRAHKWQQRSRKSASFWVWLRELPSIYSLQQCLCSFHRKLQRKTQTYSWDLLILETIGAIGRLRRRLHTS